jgi:hypothetical protein
MVYLKLKEGKLVQIKIIKKGTNSSDKNDNVHPSDKNDNVHSSDENDNVHLNEDQKSNLNEEKKVERSVSSWISEFREKKKYEFLKAQLLLTNL